MNDFIAAAIRWPHLSKLGKDQPWTLRFELDNTKAKLDRQKAVNKAIADAKRKRQ